jgi:arylsulfatase A-like enzyme
MRILLLLSLLPSLAAAQDAPEPKAQPNIVLFLVDDMGWQDTSVSFAKERVDVNDIFHTPNVERLAREGMTFTNGYASCPVCTPTRVAIHTGTQPLRNHVTYWTLNKDRDTSAKHPTLQAPKWELNGLQPRASTLAPLFRSAGYRTVHVGKAHLGAVGTPGADPLQQGFERNIAGHGAGAPGSYLGKHDFRSKGRKGEDGASIWDVPGVEAYHGKDVYLTDVLATEACREVREAVSDEVPFFLSYCPYAVHTPIMANPKYADRYGKLHPKEAAYATMVESVDAALGALIQTLEELDVLEETLIVFTSDNGGLSAHARGGKPNLHNAPLRSGKGSAYEGGVRVPWIVRYPGVAPAGSTCAVPVISHDLFPTLLNAGGIAIPEMMIDGHDLHGLFLQKRTSLADRALYWHMPHSWGGRGPGIEPFTSMRRGKWKFYYFHTDQRIELYDLAKDIGEEHDVADKHPERVARMSTSMAETLDTCGGQMSIDLASGKPVAPPKGN